MKPYLMNIEGQYTKIHKQIHKKVAIQKTLT